MVVRALFQLQPRHTRKLRRVMHTSALYVVVAIFIIWTLFPFYSMFVSSLSPKELVFSVPPQYLPPVTLENYATLVDQLPFFNYLRNSTLFSVGSALLSVAVSFLAAYAFVRIPVRGSQWILAGLVASMALPEIVTVIPLYSILRSLRMINAVSGLALVMGSVLTPFTIWALVSFIRQVPREVEEAAIIDGASLPQVLLRVVLPLMRPSLVTLFLINLISSWNNLLYPLVFTTTADAKTLTVAITEVFQARSPYGRPWELISALGMTMVFPMIIFVFVCERAIVSGLTRGSAK